MKQTFSVNIGGRAYDIDNEAYNLLDKYLTDIASRLGESDCDSMDDIEGRIADIFDERISSPMQVVTVEIVRRATAVIGRPEAFGGQKRGFSYRDGGSNSGSGSGWNQGSGSGNEEAYGDGSKDCGCSGRNSNSGGSDSGYDSRQNSGSGSGSGSGWNSGYRDGKRLYRSTDNRVIGGVCGGLAEYFEIDPSLVRIFAVILFFVPPFPSLLAYIIIWIVVPQRPDYVKSAGRKNDRSESQGYSDDAENGNC